MRKSTRMYIGFKTSFYVLRHLDSTASYLSTGLHLGFFRSWPSLYLPSSFSSVLLVLSFVSASTSMLFWGNLNTPVILRVIMPGKFWHGVTSHGRAYTILVKCWYDRTQGEVKNLLSLHKIIYQLDAIEYLLVFFQLDMFRAYTPIFRSDGCYNFFTYAAYGVLGVVRCRS